jgi:hypothetical protein
MSVPVIPCPTSPGSPGAASAASPLPPTTALPPGFTLPSGAAIYGSGATGTGGYLVLAPSADTCQASVSQDGGFTVRAIDPVNTSHGVEAVFGAGGIASTVQLSCPTYPVRRPPPSSRTGLTRVPASRRHRTPSPSYRPAARICSPRW